MSAGGLPELRDTEPLRRVLEAMELDPDEVEGAVQSDGAEAFTVRVRRVRDDNGQLVFLGAVDPDAFTNGPEELLQTTFGPGRYQVDVLRKGGNAERRHVRSKRYEIGAGPTTAAAAAPSGRVEALLERLLSERAAAPAPAAGFFDAVASVSKAMQESNAAIMVPLLNAVVQQKAPARDASPDKLLEVLLQGIKLGKETGGDGGGFGATVRELMPGFLAAVQQLGAPGAPPATSPLHALPPGEPEPTDPTMPAATAPNDAPAWVRILAPYVPQLLQLATFHADPVHWAHDVAERADGERLTFIEDQLTRGAAFREDFYRWFPAAIDRRSWFEQFFDSLTETLAAMRAEEEDDER